MLFSIHFIHNFCASYLHCFSAFFIPDCLLFVCGVCVCVYNFILAFSLSFTVKILFFGCFVVVVVGVLLVLLSESDTSKVQ